MAKFLGYQWPRRNRLRIVEGRVQEAKRLGFLEGVLLQRATGVLPFQLRLRGKT